MKKSTWVMLGAIGVLSPSLAWTASDSATNKEVQSPAVEPQGMNTNPYLSGNQAVQTPPADWTSLRGMVQLVDAEAKTVQIRDDAGRLLEVPIDRQVKIERKGEMVKLSQIQTGDIITLGKNKVPTEEKQRTY